MNSLASKIRSKLITNLPVLATFAVSKLLGFVIAALIARLFDKELSGLIFFCTGLIALSVAVNTAGLNTASPYYYPRNINRGRISRNRQLWTLASIIALFSSLLMGLFAYTLDEVRNSNYIWIVVGVIAIGSFFAAWRYLARNYLLAEGRRAESVIHESIIYNFCLAIFLILLPRGDAVLPLIGLFAASAVSGGVAMWRTWQLFYKEELRKPTALPPKRYQRTVLSVALPSMLARSGAQILNKIDVLLIGPLAGVVAVSDFSVAIRLTYLVSSIPELLIFLFTPALLKAAAAGRSNIELVRSLYRRTLGISVLVVLAVALPMIIFAEPVLTAIFGNEYGTAVPTFQILLTGKVLTAMFGPAVVLYTAMGLNRRLAVVTGGAAAINVAAGLLLIPTYGALGAALSTTLALFVMACNYLLMSRKFIFDRRESKGRYS